MKADSFVLSTGDTKEFVISRKSAEALARWLKMALEGEDLSQPWVRFTFATADERDLDVAYRYVEEPAD